MDPLSFIFPHKCFGCGKEDSYLCPQCVTKAKPARWLCPECGRTSVSARTHSKCKKPQGLDGLVSLWAHTGVMRKAIVSLKYKFAKDLTAELANQTGDYLIKSKVILLDNPVLVPIPLFWLRRHWRGFNQSEEIGKSLALRMSWDFAPRLLERTIAGTPQVELKREKRKKNVRGVFKMKRASFLDKSRSIILFDDVWTTGSTMKEAAKILKRNGIKKVWGLTITRSS